MADALRAIKYAIENEITRKKDGTIVSYCNVPGDAGGPTNWGLSQKFLVENKVPRVSVVSGGVNYLLGPWTEAAIKNISYDTATWIYQNYIWKSIFARIESQDIANYYFDMVVNHGESQATKMLQRSHRATRATDMDGKYILLGDDGIIGEKTIFAINTIVCNGCVDELSAALIATRAQFYRCLAQKPGQEKFLKGWLVRAYK